VIHQYLISGEFLQSYSLGGRSGVLDGAYSPSGVLVTAQSDSERALLGVVGDSVFDIGPAKRPDSRPPFLAQAKTGIWMVSNPWFEARLFSEPGWDLGLTVKRDVDWFKVATAETRRAGERTSNLYNFAVGENGVLWFLASREDPNAPDGPIPPFRPGPEAIAMLSGFRDHVVEAVGLDGSLLASRLYERVDEDPTPITATRWYRIDDDVLQTVVILEPVLTPR
jgi:hypothetical protein